MTTNAADICLHSLEWARTRGYQGFSKFDALNSPLLKWLAGRSPLVRAAFIFAVSRAPINVRPLLFVRKRQNPKGIALFARAYLNLTQVTAVKGLKAEALQMLDVLRQTSQHARHSGHCWGYDHPWQNTEFFLSAYEPNCVVTCTAASAMLDAYETIADPSYLEICQSVASFLLQDLTKIDVGPGMRCYSYDLHSSWKVINSNAMASAFLARLYNHTNNPDYGDASTEIMRWVLSRKTEYHAWYYSDPPSASRISHDNYHTGFVLDAILDYLHVFPDASIQQSYHDALEFYKTTLFTADHAPKWMFDRDYPHDIHGAAQAIITFSRAAMFDRSHLDFARAILDWTLTHLYARRQGRFYYQQGKHWVKRFTLMRWCQAWMCYALSVYVRTASAFDEQA